MLCSQFFTIAFRAGLTIDPGHVHELREWRRPCALHCRKHISTNMALVMRKKWPTLGSTLVCPEHCASHPHVVTNIRIVLLISLCHWKVPKTLWGWCLTGLFRCTTSMHFHISWKRTIWRTWADKSQISVVSPLVPLVDLGAADHEHEGGDDGEVVRHQVCHA